MKYKRNQKIFAIAIALLCFLSPLPAYAADGDSETASAAATEASADSAGGSVPETGSSQSEPASTQSEQGILTESDRGTSIASPSGDELELVGEGAVLMEASSGTILYSKNPEEKYYPASITKTMTTLVALEHSSLSDQLTFQADTLNAIKQDSSRVGVEAGETMTMEDALYCVMLASGNDVAAGVAEHVAGSVSGFVDMMNDKAAELGCTNTHFTNPHGLPDDQHYTCAKDMALIVQAAVQNADFCKIASAKTYTVPKTNKSQARELWNHHKMLLPASEYYYEGVAEGKTGYTSVAWNTLVTTAERDGMKLIAVVLRCQGAAASYHDTAALFDYGFERYHIIKPLADFKLKDAAEASGFSVGEVSNLEKLDPVYNTNYSILAPAEISQPDIGISITNDGQGEGVWGAIQFSYNGEEIGRAQIYYEKDSKLAAMVTEDVSPKAALISKIPFILAGAAVLLVLFILYLIVSIIRNR